MGRAFLIGITAGILAADFAFADSPAVTAVLSNSEIAVGETVELQIKVTGPGDATPPEEISIDGLEIHSTGQSRQFEIHNFSTRSSVIYNYTILPLRLDDSRSCRKQLAPAAVYLDAGADIKRRDRLVYVRARLSRGT
jgi:hypothetical protein